ncbi:hypothetical protein HPP92_008110 [Vanilla planifolia]|uniref:Uncharacterized protein n=1 Tax=Vanilla planifolia TaxID=51239 RepID=A0A835RDJ1_VANPL|nr:hypothetical protein HPP92_008110 [Vanilla planifolia]
MLRCPLSRRGTVIPVQRKITTLDSIIDFGYCSIRCGIITLKLHTTQKPSTNKRKEGEEKKKKKKKKKKNLRLEGGSMAVKLKM